MELDTWAVLVAVLPSSAVLRFIISIAIDSKTLPKFTLEFTFISISIAIDDNSIDKLVIFPNSFEEDTTIDGKFALALFFVIDPLADILSVWTFEGAETLLAVVLPLSLIVCVFEVDVLTVALLVAVHPLPLIDYVFSETGRSRSP